jgi:hypothetical protein
VGMRGEGVTAGFTSDMPSTRGGGGRGAMGDDVARLRVQRNQVGNCCHLQERVTASPAPGNCLNS